MKGSKDLLTPINRKRIKWDPIGEHFIAPAAGDKTFQGKRIEKPYGFLKGSKDLLTPINGKSINWTASEILRISLRGIKQRLK